MLDVPHEFAAHAVIPPPEKSIGHKRVFYFIDSRNRNVSKYPTPTNYNIEFHEPIQDVVSIEMIGYNIPMNEHNITSAKSVLKYTTLYDNVVHTIRIPQGMRVVDGSHLTDVLNTAANETPLSFEWTNERLVITSSSDIDILITNSPIARILGFPNNSNINVIANTSVIALYPPDLRATNYIMMFLEHAKRIDSNTQKHHKCFAVINRFIDSDGNRSYEDAPKKNISAPIHCINRLKIRFVDEDGEPYDFQNQDHSIQFVFTCSRQSRSYTDVLH
jgi:hypothetical protein